MKLSLLLQCERARGQLSARTNNLDSRSRHPVLYSGDVRSTTSYSLFLQLGIVQFAHQALDGEIVPSTSIEQRGWYTFRGIFGKLRTRGAEIPLVVQ
jgi:hypothetical protein